MPLPQTQQWSLARLQEVDTTPWSKFEGPAPVLIPQEARPDEVAPARDHMARRLYIRQKDLEDHGYTPNCPRCDHIVAYGHRDAQNSNHSETCRRRILEELSKTEEGKARIDKANVRGERFAAEQIAKTHAVAQGEIAAPAPAAAEYEPRHDLQEPAPLETPPQARCDPARAESVARRELEIPERDEVVSEPPEAGRDGGMDVDVDVDVCEDPSRDANGTAATAVCCN